MVSKIIELENESGAEDNDKLQRLKAASFKVSWFLFRETPQPGMTYYLQKMLYDVLVSSIARVCVSCTRNYWSKQR